MQHSLYREVREFSTYFLINCRANSTMELETYKLWLSESPRYDEDYEPMPTRTVDALLVSEFDSLSDAARELGLHLFHRLLFEVYQSSHSEVRFDSVRSQKEGRREEL